MKFAQLVMGPAGSGKSTYCATLQRHGLVSRRPVHVINLDPAADSFRYEPSADVRELVTVQDVAEEMELGPNGALVYCMEYVVEDGEWLESLLDGFADEDYLVLDMPGQIELYTHYQCVKRLVCLLEQQLGVRCCGVFLLDSQFMVEPSKFFAGALTALSVMMQLGIPHVNVLSKLDLLRDVDAERLQQFLEPDASELVRELRHDDDAAAAAADPRLRALTEALGVLLEDYSMVRFAPLDISDEESIEDTVMQVNTALQYDEELEVREAPELAADLHAQLGAEGNGGGVA